MRYALAALLVILAPVLLLANRPEVEANPPAPSSETCASPWEFYPMGPPDAEGFLLNHSTGELFFVDGKKKTLVTVKPLPTEGGR